MGLHNIFVTLNCNVLNYITKIIGQCVEKFEISEACHKMKRFKPKSEIVLSGQLDNV